MNNLDTLSDSISQAAQLKKGQINLAARIMIDSITLNKNGDLLQLLGILHISNICTEDLIKEIIALQEEKDSS